jgi:hypothetical protein
MVVTRKKLERTLIMERIEISKVRKLRGDENRLLLICLAIKDFYLMAIHLEGGSKVGQPDRLSPPRGLIEIPNRRLNEKDLHDYDNKSENKYNRLKIACFL